MISKLIRDAIKAQLSAPSTGFNDRLIALASSYAIDPSYQVDWDPASVNFIFGQVDPALFEESSVFTYPLMTIDTLNTLDTGMVFAATFSGVVTGIIEVHHSWENEAVLGDFASVLDLTEHALIFCLKDPANQQWGRGVNNLLLRKGGVSSQRSKISFNGENWLQSLRVLLQFELAV